MSRSGYTEDCEDVWQWRGRVASSIRGKRGQKLLRDLRDALDAMTRKRLITCELMDERGEYCILGVLGAKRGIDIKNLDPENYTQVAKAFDIADCLACEIVYENDEEHTYATPEERWGRMRGWVDRQILSSTS